MILCKWSLVTLVTGASIMYVCIYADLLKSPQVAWDPKTGTTYSYRKAKKLLFYCGHHCSDQGKKIFREGLLDNSIYSFGHCNNSPHPVWTMSERKYKIVQEVFPYFHKIFWALKMVSCVSWGGGRYKRCYYTSWWGAARYRTLLPPLLLNNHSENLSS